MRRRLGGGQSARLTALLPPGPALVVGYGRSGRALTSFLARRRIPVRVVDRDPGLKAPPAQALVEARFGPYGSEALEGCGSVYLSPGVAWDSEIALEAASGQATDPPVGLAGP